MSNVLNAVDAKKGAKPPQSASKKPDKAAANDKAKGGKGKKNDPGTRQAYIS